MSKLRKEAAGEGAGGAGTPLEAALRRVTHSQSVAVPSGAVDEVVCLACESEEALALVLRHIEENAGAAAKEWRRIHGSLVLLEKMLKPGLNGESLVGRTWYEGKIQERLLILADFQWEDDPRVAGLIKRAAGTAIRAAELHMPRNGGSRPHSPAGRTDDCGVASIGGGGRDHDLRHGDDMAGTGESGGSSQQKSSELCLRKSPISPKTAHLTKQELATPAVIGRFNDPFDCIGGADDVEAAMAATRVKAANFRSLPPTLRGTQESEKPSEGTPAIAAISISANPSDTSRSFCCCCRRRDPSGAFREAPPGENEDDCLL